MPVKKINANEIADLNDSELLKLRFKDLQLILGESDISDYIQKFHTELANKGLNFKPDLFFGDEWFSPEGMNAISIPFYLASTRLRNLEKTNMLDVEGGDAESFMKLVRHEAGHCFDHCFRFSKRKKWSEVFGSPNLEYQPDKYRPQPYSKSYVKHLDRWYAQAHPDEDFAETFAVWLNPDIDWQKEYQKWPVALAKLKYLDQLAAESLKLKNFSESGRYPGDVRNLTSTLEKYYQKRKRENADEYPDFYDSDLKKIFNGTDEVSKKEFSASRFMKKHRKSIIAAVAWATNERKFTIDSLVRRLTLRCQNLNLKLGKSETQTTMEAASFLTSLVKNYLFTGKFKREV